ncbi:hypothetical protein KAFR_0B06310 [Kazachstania africana CBS 2517]|uniref:Translation initiation factor eIF2B subunit epsilon n=1 Tax=Kazachstania africana (strain ATCC 22294 / BCRC 22015 / CBS 2517 / CECT 1963 / NBRC 1671 / NRRL Y-8276) TaxID=1071382 RepID=H2ARC7_KAZAF|nr:hypothetical protein KAFR_0B06310 [Kazachstania africana CBS 2517]CCF56927.1 hypothetical protein KAFR_0B06310 [Kazachstania africana CBS 2517]
MTGRKGKTSSKKKNAGSNSKKNEVDVDDRLQAVVLTDSFESRFMPLTAKKPRCLLPLANVPLIEYTLEFLATAGVDEVYLSCSSHANQINNYIENSKWNSPWSPFRITTIMSPEARSVGDVMRDLDNRGIITGDFLLVSGDIVTNMDFNKMLAVHKKVHSLDKDHIATMCLSEATQYCTTRTFDPAAFVLEKNNNRCIYYQDLPSINSKEKTAVQIDPELLENVDEFVLRNDLIDCRIDICTPHVPPIFQENFDYQTLRTDFVKGVISSDILGKHIYAYITDEYVSRVESWQSYNTISQDYVGRWCYPLVLDSNMQSDQTYSYESRHIYKEEHVVLAQSCKIGRNTVIGSGSKIGEGTTIENSIIGRNCQIGEGIKIKDCYIWENTIIGDNSTLEHSIIASGAKLGEKVILNDGCIIGFNVIIDDDMIIPKGTKISDTPVKNLQASIFEIESDEEQEDAVNEVNNDSELALSLVGSNGHGYIYDSDITEDEDDSSNAYKISNTLTHQLEEFYLSDASISSTRKRSKKKRSMSSNSVYTDREDVGSDFDDEDENEDFEEEGVATVERALENNHDLDTALLELNTLRMSMNVTYHEVRMVTVKALLKRVYHFIATQTLGPKDATVKVFSQWGLFFKRQAFDEDEFIDLMDIVMDEIIEQGIAKPDVVLFSVLNTLYDLDVLEEDIIYKWWDNGSESSKYDEIKTLTAKWVDWLRTADEESSSDENADEE